MFMQQCRHLLDEQKSKETEFRYGTITGKYVIYQGENAELKEASEPISYLNVEDYLKNL